MRESRRKKSAPAKKRSQEFNGLQPESRNSWACQSRSVLFEPAMLAWWRRERRNRSRAKGGK